MITAALLAFFVLALLYGTWHYVRFVLSVYQLFWEQLALASCDSSRPAASPARGAMTCRKP